MPRYRPIPLCPPIRKTNQIKPTAQSSQTLRKALTDIELAWKMIFRGATPQQVQTATGLPWAEIDRYFRLRQQELNSK